MGKLNVKDMQDPLQHRAFMKRLLNEMSAFEAMLESDMIESNVRRIGAEQELFIVDQSGRPANLAEGILERIQDSHYTPELAKFNLEFNLDPLPFSGDCFGKMEQQIDHLMHKVRGVAAELEAELVMTGILPSIRQSDLGLSSMMPNPRYQALNDAMAKARGDSDYEIRLTGLEELILKQNSVMAEACNNSFQLHFQVGKDEFAKFYNLCQAVTGPLLSMSANSPMLFGKRLWNETRIALFQQSTDTRSVGHQMRDRTGRVSFGDKWVDDSILELLHENIARFRVLISVDMEDEDPFAKIANGEAPEFEALRLHNGTIYRWNRPCYGVIDGKAHLRIENRVLPAGPTSLDEVANSALFFGVLTGLAREYPNFTEIMEFDDAKANFYTAARQGIGAFMTWIHRKVYPCRELVLKELLPLAREGLQAANILKSDIDRYLGVIEERAHSGKTGATWLLHSVLKLQKESSPDQMSRALVQSTIKRQKVKNTVQDWTLPKLRESEKFKGPSLKVDHMMSTDLYTIHPEELADLGSQLMEWKNMRDIPVEDEKGALVGMVRYQAILEHLLSPVPEEGEATVPVKDIMEKDPFTLTSDNSPREAILAMREHKTTIPVIKGGLLVGILSDYESSHLMKQILEEQLKDNNPDLCNLMVQDVMTRELSVVNLNSALQNVVGEMAKNRFLNLLVTNSRNDLVGVINYRRVLREKDRLHSSEPIPVREILKDNPVTVLANTPILEAINLMHEQQVGCLPALLEDGTLVGLLTEFDLIKIAELSFSTP